MMPQTPSYRKHEGAKADYAANGTCYRRSLLGFGNKYHPLGRLFQYNLTTSERIRHLGDQWGWRRRNAFGKLQRPLMLGASSLDPAEASRLLGAYVEPGRTSVNLVPSVSWRLPRTNADHGYSLTSSGFAVFDLHKSDCQNRLAYPRDLADKRKHNPSSDTSLLQVSSVFTRGNGHS
jgi:hypothetical protein